MVDTSQAIYMNYSAEHVESDSVDSRDYWIENSDEIDPETPPSSCHSFAKVQNGAGARPREWKKTDTITRASRVPENNSDTELDDFIFDYGLDITESSEDDIGSETSNTLEKESVTSRDTCDSDVMESIEDEIDIGKEDIARKSPSPVRLRSINDVLGKKHMACVTHSRSPISESARLLSIAAEKLGSVAEDVAEQMIIADMNLWVSTTLKTRSSLIPIKSEPITNARLYIADDGRVKCMKPSRALSEICVHG